MIRSMTGYGAAERLDPDVRIAVEIRTVNNRFFKFNAHLPDGLGAIEPAVDKLLREDISRGTVNFTLIVEPRGAAARVPINREILAAYWKDLSAAVREMGGATVSMDAVLALPGVVGSADVLLTGVADLPARVMAVAAEAVKRLDAMRQTEGQATAADMRAALDEIERRIAVVQQRVPAVIEDYRNRLRERVQMLLEGAEVPLDDEALLREVAFFAERSDINEELARLSSHVAQYRELLGEAGPGGRKLEFLTQEMYREVNTIGSKSGDSDISRQVVEIKVNVDRLKEQSQNVE